MICLPLHAELQPWKLTSSIPSLLRLWLGEVNRSDTGSYRFCKFVSWAIRRLARTVTFKRVSLFSLHLLRYFVKILTPTRTLTLWRWWRDEINMIIIGFAFRVIVIHTCTLALYKYSLLHTNTDRVICVHMHTNILTYTHVI